MSLRIGNARTTAWAILFVSALSLAGCQREAPPPLDRPNVILFTLESLRTDHVGAYGGASTTRPEEPLTPTLDALAEEGVVYEDAHSVTSWTLASHASLFTGLYPSVHQTNTAHSTLHDSYVTIAERVAELGYQTAGVISGPYLRRAHNLNQGFESWEDEIAAPGHVQAHGDVTNDLLFAGLRRFIEEQRDEKRPFFLFSYVWDPHYDFIPPKPYSKMFLSPECEPVDVTGFGSTNKVNINSRPGQLAYVLSQYAGEIRWTDEHLREFFQLLKDEGLWENTAILVTADHGEEFFDHGKKGHFNNVYAETVHVPLIVKYPGSKKVGRDPRLASLVDVLPTIVELAGGQAPDLGGHSLLGPPPGPERPIFFELESVWYHRRPGAKETIKRHNTWQGIRRGDHKLVRNPESNLTELFDVANDPREREDLAAALPEQVTALTAELDSWLAEAKELANRFDRAGSAELSEEELERLRSLGYIDR